MLQTSPKHCFPAIACGVLSAFQFAPLAEAETAGSLDIASLSLDELMSLEVTTPGKVPEEIRDTPASVYLVSREDIETYGYRTLTDVFENVPGFYNVDNYTGVSGNFGVRGFWNGRSQNSSVAILINGVPQSRSDLWSNPMESLNVPVEAIDRVEISRGPNSVIYGNGASFGAINIITNDSYVDDQVTVSYGGYGTKTAALRVSEFGEDFHVIVNAGIYDTEGLDHDLRELVGEENRVALPLFGVTDHNASLDGKMEQRYSQLQLSAEWKDVYFELTRNDSDVEAFSGYPAVTEGNLRNAENTRMTLGAELSLGGELRLDTHLIYNTFDSDEAYDALYPGFEGYHGVDFNNWEFESLLSYVPSDELLFVAGVNWQRMQNYRELTHIPPLNLLNETVVIDKRVIRAAFAQLNYQISEPLRLVAGYRVEELKPHRRLIYADNAPTVDGVKGGQVNGMPRLSLIYQPSQSQVLKLMAGDAVKFPSFPDLMFPSERVRTVEVNYTHTQENLLLSGSVFVNSHRDLITEEIRFLPNFTIDNDRISGGEADTRGVEALASLSFADAYRAEFGVTYQESDYSFHPEGFASYSPELVAHAKVAYEREGFSASGLARFVDGMRSFYNVNPDEPADRPDGYFGEPVGSYLVVDANVRWSDLWHGTFVSLHVSNLFDTEVRYPNNPINGRLLDRGHIGYGRMLSVKAGVQF